MINEQMLNCRDHYCSFLPSCRSISLFTLSFGNVRDYIVWATILFSLHSVGFQLSHRKKSPLSCTLNWRACQGLRGGSKNVSPSWRRNNFTVQNRIYDSFWIFRRMFEYFYVGNFTSWQFFFISKCWEILQKCLKMAFSLTSSCIQTDSCILNVRHLI